LTEERKKERKKERKRKKERRRGIITRIAIAKQ
jgi:hypothetical protein